VACRSVAVTATRQLLDQQEHDQRHESCGLRCAQQKQDQCVEIDVCARTLFVCSSRPPPTLWPLWTCSSARPLSTHNSLTRITPWTQRAAAILRLPPLARFTRARVAPTFSALSFGRKQTSGSIHSRNSSSAVGAQQPCLIGTGTCGSSDVLTTPVSALVSARISSVLPQRHPNARHDVCWCGVLSAPIGGWLPPHTVHRHLFLSACVLACCAWMHMARAKQPPPAVATA
jgi:hypothetical protein